MRFDLSVLRNSTIVVVCLIILTGCSFIGLHEDVKVLNTATVLKGTVSSSHETKGPILVTLVRINPGEEYSLEYYTAYYEPGEFELLAGPGDFYLFAFEDKNQDFKLQTDEYVGWHGDPTVITLEPGEKRADLDLSLLPPDQVAQRLPQIYEADLAQQPIAMDYYRMGEVISLDSHDISEEVGRLGMWEPYKFFERKYSGIFFLEPYDPTKIPVLFVHGLAGSGNDWRYLIQRLDRTKFQPWISQYPSGMRLELLGQILSEGITELHIKLKFNNLAIVAHSMGGLITRSSINFKEELNAPNYLKKLITISTPWDGHDRSSIGVNYAPSVVPAWYDLEPDSPFLENLMRQNLRRDLQHYLIFSYRNHKGILGPQNSDGVVTLQSQLHYRAQEQATDVIGFDETHSTVLQSGPVSDTVNNLLNGLKMP